MKKLLFAILFIATLSFNTKAQDLITTIDSIDLFTNEVLISDSTAWWNTYTLFNCDADTPVPCQYMEFDVDIKYRGKDGDKIAIIINDVIYEDYEIDSTITVLDTTYIDDCIDHVDTIEYDTIVNIPLIHDGYNRICFGNTSRNVGPYFSDVNYVYNIEIFSINENNYNADGVYTIKDINIVKDNSKKKAKRHKEMILPFLK